MGRPKGSKNKTTIEKERQKELMAQRQELIKQKLLEEPQKKKRGPKPKSKNVNESPKAEPELESEPELEQIPPQPNGKTKKERLSVQLKGDQIQCARCFDIIKPKHTCSCGFIKFYQ